MKILSALAFVLALGWRVFASLCKLTPRCPFCESGEVRRIEDGGEYICGDCEHIF